MDCDVFGFLEGFLEGFFWAFWETASTDDMVAWLLMMAWRLRYLPGYVRTYTQTCIESPPPF